MFVSIVVSAAACGSVSGGAPIDAAGDDDAARDAPADSGAITLDRQHVVYSAADAAGVTQIFQMRLDGTDKRQITHEAQDALFGSVSPDGTKVAFTTTIGGNEDIFLENIDGTGRRQLTTSTASDFRPTFSADGKRIAYVSTRDTAVFNVYIMTVANGDAGEVTRVSASANQQEFPVMGGTNLVTWTESLPVASATQNDILTAHEDGSAKVNLTNNAAGDNTSAYSADGTKIVFSSDRAGGGISQLWMMNADGSNPTQITTDATMNRFHPSFDATAEHVIYSGAPVGAGNQLFIANLDGTNETQLSVAADGYREKLSTWVFVK